MTSQLSCGVYCGENALQRVDHESQLYAPIRCAIYGPVNQAAHMLGPPLEYTTSRGAGNTLRDLRAANTRTLQPYIAHEVKASPPWPKAPKGEHFADLLMSNKSEPSIVMPAVQILYYMVEEWSMYGILSSKVQHVFLRRSPDPRTRHIDITKTFNSESQTNPPVRLMYLYMLHLASTADRLDPRDRPPTAAEDKEDWQKHKAST